MKAEQRLFLLKIGAVGVAALFLLDRLVITPIMHGWAAQSERLDELQQKVQRGQQLLDREQSIRGQWADIMRANLPSDVSAAEDQAFKALTHWGGNSHIVFTSVSPQWVTHDEGYRSYECRITATGNQAAIARFIYELENDSIPVNLEECELAARDTHGADLNFTAKFSFLRISDNGGRAR